MEVAAMKVRVEVVCLNADGEEQRRQVLTIERQELAMETLGVNLTEGKALLAGVQDFVVTQQAREELEQRRACPRCHRRYTIKDSGGTPVSTVFGREGSEQEWERQPLPDGPITVGIDGGYVRAAHKQGWFEVIAGKSVVAFRRDDEGEVSSAKCFGFVQTYDEKPRRRLWELMKSQGMQENQQVVFMSDGGENVRRVQEYLHPFSEHLIDWFHITMRLTVLQQQTKALQEERPETGAEVSKRLESLKHLLWHGNTEEALERLGDLLVELSFIHARSNAAKKVADNLSEFETYICNNREFIPNFGERRRQGETISTAFVESTINQVVSRRFVKKQQMQWTLRGAHLLLQTRTRVLNEDLDDLFRRRYPKFRPQPQTQEPERKAA